MYVANLLRKGLIWRVGNGFQTKFWTDNWAPSGILLNHAINLDIVNTNSTVNEFWIDGSWNMIMLGENLPQEIIAQVLYVPITECDIPDQVIWGQTSSGIFFAMVSDGFSFTSLTLLDSLLLQPILINTSVAK